MERSANNNLYYSWETGAGNNDDLRLYGPVAWNTPYVQFKTDGKVAFMSGNVGIGTAEPVAKLQVDGGTGAVGGVGSTTKLWSASELKCSNFWVCDGVDGYAFNMGTGVSDWWAWDSNCGMRNAIRVYNDGTQIQLGYGFNGDTKMKTYICNCVQSPIVCATTCVQSPIICGTSCVTGVCVSAIRNVCSGYCSTGDSLSTFAGQHFFAGNYCCGAPAVIELVGGYDGTFVGVNRIVGGKDGSNGPYAGCLQFQVQCYDGSNYRFKQVMTLRSGGNVGIGTTSPGNKLAVYTGDVACEGIAICSGTGNDISNCIGIKFNTIGNLTQCGELVYSHKDANSGELGQGFHFAGRGSGGTTSLMVCVHGTGSIVTSPIVCASSCIMANQYLGSAAQNYFIGVNDSAPYDSAWGTSSRGIGINSSTYAVIHLKGANNQATRYSMGVGDGSFYMAYDDIAGAHRLCVNSSGEVKVTCGGFFGDIDVGAVGGVTIKTCTATNLHLQDGHNHHVITNSNSTGVLRACNAICAGGDITAYASDCRMKCNILTITCAVDRVKALRGVEFEWDGKYICDNNINFTPYEKGKTVGFIAQELENTLPTAVREAPLEGGLCRNVSWEEKYKTVKAEKILPLLVEATKEQQCTIDKQQRQIDRLTCQVELLLRKCA